MGNKKKFKPNHSSPSQTQKTESGPTSSFELSVSSMPWTKTDRLLFAGSILIITLVYWFTMWPSVGGGDSGELTAAAYTLGIVHPPGYPLYTMLAHLFTMLPFGTVAWRVNLFSVAAGVGALTFLFLILRRLTGRTNIAAVTTTMIAFSPLFWRYSVVAEVFSLNTFFVALLLYLFIRFNDEPKPILVYVMAFTFGLGLTNHHTLLFLGTPLGLWLLWNEPEYRRPLNLVKIIALFFIGLLPYAYLFWSSARVPLIAWGDITTWDGFTTHLFRKEYGTFKLATEGSNNYQLLWGLGLFVLSLAQHALYVGAPFIVAGIWALWKKPKGLPVGVSRLLLFIPLFYLIIFHTLANLPFVDGAALFRDIVSRFWIMPTLIGAIYFAVGFRFLTEKIPAQYLGWQYALMVIFPLGTMVLNFNNENHRDNYNVANFGRHMVESLPKDAVFFTLGDINTNSVRYMQTCEAFRQDVAVLDRSLLSYPWMKRIVSKHYPDVTIPGVAYNPGQKGSYDFKRLFDANYDRHPIYMNMIKTKDSNEATDKAYESTYQLVPYGLSFKVVNKDHDFHIDEYIETSKKFLAEPLVEFTKPPLPDSWDAVILGNYWLAHHIRAAEILKYALKTQEKQYFVIAEQLLEDLVARNKAPPADYFKNLGIAHQHLLKYSEGEEKKHHEQRMLETWDFYVTKTDMRDKTYEDIKTNLRAYGKLK